MLLKLPRLPLSLQITESGSGKPLKGFAHWWDELASQIEDNLNRVNVSQDAAEAAQAAAIAAQASANAAVAAAGAAQVSADSANAAIAGLGTAAHADTGISGHVLPFLDGTNAFSGSDSFASLSATAATATRLDLPALINAANDAAAAGAGVAIGQIYRNGSQVMVRVT